MTIFFKVFKFLFIFKQYLINQYAQKNIWLLIIYDTKI